MVGTLYDVTIDNDDGISTYQVVAENEMDAEEAGIEAWAEDTGRSRYEYDSFSSDVARATE